MLMPIDQTGNDNHSARVHGAIRWLPGQLLGRAYRFDPRSIDYDDSPGIDVACAIDCHDIPILDQDSGHSDELSVQCVP
jgi:hypothetical protein